MKTILAPFHFKGGVHPSYNKNITHADPVGDMPLPPILKVAMAQHLGAPAKPVVAAGDTVLRGQLIGEAAGFVSANVHAPTSGKVAAIEDGPTPAGRAAAHVVIESDGEDKRGDTLEPWEDWRKREPGELVERVAAAGIVGMGGAGFPTRIKLSPPADKPIDTLIINGAECEPYLTGDHRAMLEQSERIWEGIEILRHILKVGKVRVAIESNKPDAVMAMTAAGKSAKGDVAVAVLDTLYPQGSEKQQIYAVTGREVPSSGLPMDIGCLVSNIATVMAIRDAVVEGFALDERVVTVAGSGIAKPRNVRARVGSPFSALIEACGGFDGEIGKVIAGGPMMGFAQHTLDVAVSKTTSGILALKTDDVQLFSSQACIACGRCNDACPMGLLPSELGILIEADDIETAEEYHLMDCFECGSCAFVCPAHRPLVQHMRRAKAAVLLKRRIEKAQP